MKVNVKDKLYVGSLVQQIVGADRREVIFWGVQSYLRLNLVVNQEKYFTQIAFLGITQNFYM